MEGTNLGIEDRIPIAAAIVIIDYAFESGNAAVMHVGGRARDLPQRGRFECATVLVLSRNGETARICQLPDAPGNPGVVEAFVGEVGADMTGNAVAFAAKKAQPLARFCRKSILVTTQVPVIRRVSRENASNVAGQGACQVLPVDLASEPLSELRAVVAVMPQPRH